MKENIINGECILEMKKMKENSIDCAVVDSPYGIAFMNKSFDVFKNNYEFQKFTEE